MKLVLSILLSVTLLASCAEESGTFIRDKTTSEGSIKGGVYTSKKFGWSINVPDSWEIVTSSSELEEARKLGRSMINDANLDVPQGNQPVKLLFAKKNDSSIVAVAEKITATNDVSVEKQTYGQKQIVTKMYETQGFPIMESGIDEGILGGEKCGVVRFAIGQKPLQILQLYYVFKRKGYWFSIIATFDNDEDRDEIYEALNGCTFN